MMENDSRDKENACRGVVRVGESIGGVRLLWFRHRFLSVE